MKRFFLNIVKFITILLCLFFGIFVSIVLFHSASEIRLGEFSQECLMQTFLLSLFTSCFLSIVIFNAFCLSEVNTYRMITMLISVVVTTIFISVSLQFINKDEISSEFTLSNDARLYFTPECFISYNEVIDESFTVDDFEKNILAKIEDDKSRNYIRSKFVSDNKSYSLKSRILDYDYDKILQILYSIGYYQDTKYFFEGVSKNGIGKAIITKNGESSFYQNLLVSYSNKYIYVTSDDFNLSLVFNRNKLINNNFHHTFINDMVISSIQYFPFYFTTPSSVLNCIILWFSFAMLIMSLFSIVLFKSFKFITLIFHTAVVMIIYIFMPQIMSLYSILAKLPISNDFFYNLIFSGILIVISVIMILLNVFVFKSGVWEED